MHVEFNTRKKLTALLGQISQLLLSDFPHASSRTALEIMQRYFQRQSERLDRAARSNDHNFVAQACVSINERIYQYLPILGFLLRSTNNRNAFEAYHSLLEMARALIGPTGEVIVSSEWDFSPLTYPLTLAELPNYVLIGMPSSESSNALILPLAGHELGHSVWQNETLEDRYTAQVENDARLHLKTHWRDFQQATQPYSNVPFSDQLLISDPSLIDVISRIVGLSLSQIEETFCDAMGISLFGPSYAVAFHYLLAPSLGGTRTVDYPSLTIRAKNIETLGGIDLARIGFANYASEFRERQSNLTIEYSFIVSAADRIAQRLAKSMYELAAQLAQTKAGKFRPDAKAHDDILAMFEYGVPANSPRSMSDILNAGWTHVLRQRGTFDETERSLVDWVSELILKSLEVLEYRTRTSHAGLS